MAQISPRHARSARTDPRKAGISKSLGRRLVAGAALLVLVIVLAAVLTPRGFAQPNSNKPDLFGRKTDKTLQPVRKAHARLPIVDFVRIAVRGDKCVSEKLQSRGKVGLPPAGIRGHSTSWEDC